MKMLVWFIIGFFVVMWYLHAKKARQKAARRERPADSGGAAPGASSAAPGAPADAPAAASESMLRCAQCGLHIPSSEAVTATDGQLSYCSDEHRRQHSG
ncbi:PP0621 family protein [Lacisediminimonas sp.]|uniref:PP0621 family protein n=1 Tax=Lacisediminimonas sp. TaxID=3060582 RepID=UPI002721A0EA|nr:PP0621 family protein [Lacisediminimonas sp.]MDO8300637.1 PP0621 family protein [Lacisediminimonas sp.]